MNREAHQAWLEELAAKNLRSRARAAPELARKEAAFRAARDELASTQAAVQELEVKLEAERRKSDDPDGG